jgi:hypothetical protein
LLARGWDKRTYRVFIISANLAEIADLPELYV